MDELDFELVDDLDEGGDDYSDTNEQDDSSDDIEGDEPSKKNPSNFKKLAKAHKWAIARIKELEAQVGKTTKGANEELRFFFLENPEAKEYKTQMLELMSLDKYKSLDVDDILNLAKLKTPPQSTDSNDFSLKSTTPKIKKRLEDLSDEEALKLDNKTYLEYSRRTRWGTINTNIWG